MGVHCTTVDIDDVIVACAVVITLPVQSKAVIDATVKSAGRGVPWEILKLTVATSPEPNGELPASETNFVA